MRDPSACSYKNHYDESKHIFPKAEIQFLIWDLSSGDLTSSSLPATSIATSHATSQLLFKYLVKSQCYTRLNTHLKQYFDMICGYYVYCMLKIEGQC